jgi:hypothetical protein
MAARPFVPYAQFDVARFTDYGRQKYDKKQALLADLLPKAGPGGLREKLAGLLHKSQQPASASTTAATDDAAPADRRAARKGVLRSLLDATLRRRQSPPDRQRAAS